MSIELKATILAKAETLFNYTFNKVFILKDAELISPKGDFKINIKEIKLGDQVLVKDVKLSVIPMLKYFAIRVPPIQVGRELIIVFYSKEKNDLDFNCVLHGD